RFPPGIAGVERLLRSVADLRHDGAGNDECHNAIGVKMRWGACCWRGDYFDQADIAQRLAREVPPGHGGARPCGGGTFLLWLSRARGGGGGGRRARGPTTATANSPGDAGLWH